MAKEITQVTAMKILSVVDLMRRAQMSKRLLALTQLKNLLTKSEHKQA